jgi:hypothetical protein
MEGDFLFRQSLHGCSFPPGVDADDEWFDARPHPGLLPQEKEKRAQRFWNITRRDWTGTHPDKPKS